MAKNKSDIDGDKNIVIQGCNFSKITVNTISLGEIEKRLTKFLGNKKPPINLLVITSQKERVGKHFANKEFETDFVDSYYATELSNWKPYAEESILSLLQEYRSKSGFNIETYLIDSGENPIEDLFLSILKSIQADTILIADCIALQLSGNKKIAQEIFNNKEIGGCLIPICSKLPIEVQQHYQTLASSVFYSLNHFHNRYSDTFLNTRNDKGYLHIDLQIPNKNKLFRLLTTLATLHLKPTREREFPDLNETIPNDIPEL